MQHVLIGKSEKGYPLSHKFLFIGPFFTKREFDKFWLEVVSWNPAGHNTKIIATKRCNVTFAVILYANPKFKQLLIKTFKFMFCAKRTMIQCSGDFEIYMRVNNRAAKKLEALNNYASKKASQDYVKKIQKEGKIRDWPYLNYKTPDIARADDRAAKIMNLVDFIDDHTGLRTKHILYLDEIKKEGDD